MTSGLESMIIGEDQILGQTKDAYQKAKKEGHIGKILDTLFTKAIHVGQVVRNKTKINQRKRRIYLLHIMVLLER